MAQVLGRYHIISELGRGGMGVVYKALDPKLERFIAIKCLSEELSEDEIVVARFLREARNVAALNHPNIAQIFVADEHEGKPYFVMEYVDGESLADFIDREGQCSPEMARRVTEQAATALAAAAAEGIVHRDVKPGNIMLDRRGRAVLTDFGIACIAAEQVETGGSSTIMGTPGYLPPEALTGGPVDARGDMFALGAVYFEMLTGKRLIAGRGIKETFAELARPDFPDLSELEGKVDDRVLDILGRLVAVKPDHRYPDWQGLLADMAPLKTGRTGPVERPDSGPSTAEREVTEALATAKMATATADLSRQPTATAVMGEAPPARHPVPTVQPRPARKGRGLALVAIVIVALAAAGFGLARMAPQTWERVTAWMPGWQGNDTVEPAVTAAGSGAPSTDPVASDSAGNGEGRQGTAGTPLRAGQSVAAAEGGDGPPSDSAAGEVFPPGDGGSEASIVAVGPDEDLAAGEVDPQQPEAEVSPAIEPESGEDRALAIADADSTATVAEPARATRPAPAPPPSGIVVIGVGDPVIADPMVREIESALRAGRHPLVQRSLVSGYRRHIEGEEVDLAGLAQPALAAGARYVVIARALPAGERELQYYNRIETAYIAQLEAMTFDLHEMRQLGSSPVEQIEFTSLNATERAVASVRPWLTGIRDQFD